MYKIFLTTFFALLLFCSSTTAQQAEIGIKLDEAFFDALLDGIFQHAPPPEFAIAQRVNVAAEGQIPATGGPSISDETGYCAESIKVIRENNGVRTAVRFRNGKILAPLAFTGNYNPPLIGCINFAGYAETEILLEFDRESQRLIARAKVLNVALNGTRGVGGTVIAKMVQSSIDRKVNPIEVLKLDKISFLVPVRRDAELRVKASSIRHEILDGFLNVHISYEFMKP